MNRRGVFEVSGEDEMVLPELVYGVFEKKLDFIGYLVIDSMFENRSCGGIRMSSEVTLNEVRSLARNMTLKFSFLGIPMGGAKAGIQINAPSSINWKRLILAEFGKRLSPFIKNGLFIPGTDMGTSEQDIAWFLKAAKGEKNGYVYEKSSHGSEYTSCTMLSSARQALKTLTENCAHTHPAVSLQLENADVAIEGFGKIGSSAARIFSENGAKIVAVSTCKGAIYNPNGLNIDKIIDLRNRCGDDLVNLYHGARRIAGNSLVQLSVDVLLPCAGSWTINSTNACKTRAKVICPGANLPLTDQAEQILFKRGIVCVPDFVSNSGAVLGNSMANYVSKEKTKKIIDEEFGQRVYKLLKISKKRNIYPKRVATEIAIRRFYEMKRSEGKLSRLFIRAVRFVLPVAYQRMIAKPLAPHLFKRRLRRTPS